MKQQTAIRMKEKATKMDTSNLLADLRVANEN